METCRGIEPRTRCFADSADRQIDTSWCARPELNQAVLSGTQACCRNISGAWCECPGTIRIRRFGRPQCRQLHLTRRELASGVEPVWSIIPRCAPSHGNQRVESLGNAPSRSACKAEQQPSASDPVAGLQGIEPRFTDLESVLRPSLRPVAPRMGFDPISSARQADVHAS